MARRRAVALFGALLALALTLLASACLLWFPRSAPGPPPAAWAAQQRRQRRLRDACRETDDDAASLDELSRAKLDHIVVDDAHGLLYCSVPKVASTNWKRVLLALHAGPGDPSQIPANRSHDPAAFTSLGQLSPEEARRRLRSHLKFMFARHPLERLLSAYRNKFEHAWSDYFPRRFGRTIVRRFRGAGASPDALSTGRGVTFDEFLRYVAGLDAGDHASAFNEHWRPVSDLCFPCLVRYDVVGLYHSLDQDSALVLWRAGLQRRVAFPSRARTYSSEPTGSLMDAYYGNVSAALLRQLRTVYQRDMALFRYARRYPPFD